MSENNDPLTGLSLWEAQTLAWFAGMKFRENAKKVHDETMTAREAHLVEFESLRDRLGAHVEKLKKAPSHSPSLSEQGATV